MEIVGYEVNKAGNPLALDNGWFTQIVRQHTNNIAFDALKEVLKEERNVNLIYKNCRNAMPYDDDRGLYSYEVLFDNFDWEDSNLEERYVNYTKKIKSKIRNYIFSNYILSSEDERY